MSRIELKLFGKPCLLIDGLEVNPGRPAVFEILAKTIVAGDAGISRAELAKWMWPDLDSAKSRANLRVNLASLRIELGRLGLGSVVVTDGDLLRTQGTIDVDLHTFLSKPIHSVNELRMGTSPVAKAWDADRWQVQRDLVAVHLVSGFHTLGSKLPEDEHLALLKESVRAHPTSIPLTTMFVDANKRQQLLDAANQAVIDFENAWIDRFGTADLPNISLSPIPAPVETPRTADLPNISLGPIPALVETPRTAEGRGIATAIAVIALLGIIAAGIAIYLLLSRRTDPGPQKPRLQLSLVQSYTKTVDGVRFKVRKFKVDHPWAYMLGFHALNQTDLRVESSEALPVLLTLSDEIRPTPSDEIRNDHGITIGPWDEFRGVSVRGAINRQFKPLPGYPYLDPHILNDGSLLLSRHCEHPYVDHYRLTHFYAGAERLIAPTGPLPQITAFNVFTSTTVYGKYSYGRQEGWRYHAFRYDIQSHKFEDLSIPPVVGILDDHTLVCQPEVTTVINDDYDTHPSGEVVVIDQTTGKQIRQRWVADGNPGLGIFPPFALKIQRANTRSSKVIFLDKSLNRVNPFPELTGNFGRIESYSNQNLLLVPFDRAEQSREFWLITRLDPL